MRFEPLQGLESQALSHGLAHRLVGDEVDSLAISNLVEPQPVSKTVSHDNCPSITAPSAICSSRDQSSRKAAAVWFTFSPSGTDWPYTLATAASFQSSSC